MRSIFDNRVNFVLSTILAVLFVACFMVMLLSGGTQVADGSTLPSYDSYESMISTESPYVAETTQNTQSTEAPTTEPATTEQVRVIETTVPATTAPVATTQPVVQQNNLLSNAGYTQVQNTPVTNASVYNRPANTVAQQPTTNSNSSNNYNSATNPTKPSSSNTQNKDVSNVTNNNYNTSHITNNNNYYYNYYYSNNGDTNNPSYNEQWGKGYLVAIDNPDQSYVCGNVLLSEEDKDLLQRLCAGAFGEDFIGSTMIAQAVKNAMYFDGYTSVQRVIEDYYYNFSTNVEPNRVSKMAVEFIFDNNYNSVQHNIFYTCSKDVDEIALFRDCDQIIEYRGVVFFDKKSRDISEIL